MLSRIIAQMLFIIYRKYNRQERKIALFRAILVIALLFSVLYWCILTCIKLFLNVDVIYRIVIPFLDKRIESGIGFMLNFYLPTLLFLILYIRVQKKKILVIYKSRNNRRELSIYFMLSILALSVLIIIVSRIFKSWLFEVDKCKDGK